MSETGSLVCEDLVARGKDLRLWICWGIIGGWSDEQIVLSVQNMSKVRLSDDEVAELVEGLRKEILIKCS